MTTPSWMDERLMSPVTLLNLTQAYDSLISRLQEQQQQQQQQNEANNATERYYYDALRNLHLACTLLIQIYNAISSTARNDDVLTATTTEGGGGDDFVTAAASLHENHRTTVLQQTARRCQLLIEVLRLSRAALLDYSDCDDDDTIHDMENVHVEDEAAAHHHHHDQRHPLYAWNFSATIDLSGVDDQLETEEQSLVQMANTPIPAEQESTSSAAAAEALLLLDHEKERLYANIRREWGGTR